MDVDAVSENSALERFHFGDSGHVTAEQLRLLRSLDEQLARNLTHALSAWLRTDVTAMAAAQCTQTFREFLDGTEQCYTLPVHLPESNATGLLRWPLPLAAQMIELLLGGSGTGATAPRELTEIEDEIFRAVLEVVLREWNKVWQLLALQLEPGERSRNAGERQLLTPSERVYCFQFTLATGGITGEVCFCVAAPVLASAMRRVPSLQQTARNHTDADQRALTAAIEGARVRTGLCFPPVRLSASRLHNLHPGTTLVLPLPSNAVAELRLNEVPVAVAVPVRVGAWRAASVSALHEAAAAQTPRTPQSSRSEESAPHA